jgi:acyl-CoA synthetase (AMP-forming)/AMP-acid ligase II
LDGCRSFTELVLDRVARAPEKDALILLPADAGGTVDAGGTPDAGVAAAAGDIAAAGVAAETGDTLAAGDIATAGDAAALAAGRARPEVVSYRALDAAAQRLAGWLQERGAAGERVLILHSDRRLFAISFLACLYAGAVAVPVPPPGGRGHHEARIAGIVKDAAPHLALTDAAEAPDVSRLLAGHGHGHIPCLAADTVAPAAAWRQPDLSADTVAFLQYTSGSTREPRGVMVTHRNLLANQRAISRALGTGPDSRIGGWLPVHHDMGLVGLLLHPLWLGGTAVLMSPESFARRPVRWLEAISRHRLTVSGAPDFAYDLCTRRTTREQLQGLDLSCWETAVSGGEPIRPETWRAFSEHLAPTGFRPGALTAGYGLAEATLLVSGGRSARLPAHREVDAAGLEAHALRLPRTGRPTRSLVCCGRAVDCELRIVDPDSRAELPDGTIGEIWVRGEGVAAGYWRRPGESVRRFAARTADGRGGFLRTGDLGTVEDGAVYVTGRLSDVIVVAGRNLYPQDMEQMVQRVSALFGSTTAFAVRGERERVVVVQELRARSRYNVDLPALAAAVGSCLTREFEVSPGAVLLVRPGTVRRTTSGKVERSAMRRLFLQGELTPLHQQVDPEIQELLAWSRR